MKYQGFFKRLLAYLIDVVLLGAVIAVISMVFGGDTESKTNIIDTASPILSLIYFIILPITAIQGTVGKYVLGMKITNKEGNRVSLIQSFIRFISMALSTITLFIGYLLIAFTSKKQGLHDMISRTFVVQR